MKNVSNEQKMPPVMILCGGMGTRLRDVTELLPKPMVPIGEQPIVWHIMKTYASFGVRRFILCLGYKREKFIDFFMNYHARTSDATITLGAQPDIRFYSESAESDWEVTLVGTGLETMTGGRVARAAKYLQPEDQHFFLTYGDGVCDVDITATLRRHQASQKLLTVLAVHPAARFGEMILDGDNVMGFEEKPAQTNGYINGGYMVVNRRFIERYLSCDEDLFFEREPMRSAVADGQMQVYRHEGFWQCMDTPREYERLNELWNTGDAPWTRNWA
ncbi:MAG: glucose-1-phosphate cytidylyltransferase [Thermoguttaceae bacterium]|nr:glucose-1-phosphate cytidylyltransferase [Thermoguttaceae bacterium]